MLSHLTGINGATSSSFHLHPPRVLLPVCGHLMTCRFCVDNSALMCRATELGPKPPFSWREMTQLRTRQLIGTILETSHGNSVFLPQETLPSENCTGYVEWAQTAFNSPT